MIDDKVFNLLYDSNKLLELFRVCARRVARQLVVDAAIRSKFVATYMPEENAAGAQSKLRHLVECLGAKKTRSAYYETHCRLCPLKGANESMDNKCAIWRTYLTTGSTGYMSRDGMIACLFKLIECYNKAAYDEAMAYDFSAVPEITTEADIPAEITAEAGYILPIDEWVCKPARLSRMLVDNRQVERFAHSLTDKSHARATIIGIVKQYASGRATTRGRLCLLCPLQGSSKCPANSTNVVVPMSTMKRCIMSLAYNSEDPAN